MPCSSESKGCCAPKASTAPSSAAASLSSMSSPAPYSATTTIGSIMESMRSSRPVETNGTSTVLAMLPAGKSCCNTAGPIKVGGGGCGDTGNNNNNNNNINNNNATVNDSSNVLLQYTLQDLDRRAESNFWLGLICLGVCAVNVVLVYLNWCMHHADPHPKVSKRAFHLLEFWTSFVYAVTETFALIMSPKTMLHIYKKPNLLKLLLFFNVVNSMVPALFMTLDFHYFETLSHEMEFMNSFTLSFITMILVVSLLNPPTIDEETDWNLPPQNESESEMDKSSIIMGALACFVALTNFIVYNEGRHQAAHYLEFTFNIIVSLITFWFCMDNRFVAQMEIGQILYGRHQNCIFCQIRGNEMEEQLKNSAQMQYMFGDNSDSNINSNNNPRGPFVAENDHQRRKPDSAKNGSIAFDEEMQSERTPLMNGNRSSPDGGLVTITSDEQFRDIIVQHPLVVVCMHAAWCRNSKHYLPVFATLAQKYASQAYFYTMDVDEVEEIAEEYILQETPTTVVFQNGRLQGTQSGSSHLGDFVRKAVTR